MSLIIVGFVVDPRLDGLKQGEDVTSEIACSSETVFDFFRHVRFVRRSSQVGVVQVTRCVVLAAHLAMRLISQHDGWATHALVSGVALEIHHFRNLSKAECPAERRQELRGRVARRHRKRSDVTEKVFLKF